MRSSFTTLAALTALLAIATVSAACTYEWCSREAVPSDVNVPVLIAVKHKNLDVLDKIFWDVSNPKSDSFRKFLTLQQLNDIIGNEEGTAAVRAFLAEAGIADAVIEQTPGGEFIRFRAPVRDVEAMLKVSYAYHYHRVTEGRRVPRSTVDYTVPAAIAEHVDFIGYVRELPHDMAAYGVEVTNATHSDHDDFFNDDSTGNVDTKVTPSVLYSAYGISPHSGSHGAMAVFEALGQAYVPSDLATFQQEFDVPSAKVSNIIGPNKYADCASNPNNCGEANLDVQYIMAVAEGIPLTFWSIPSTDQTPYLDWITAVAADSNPPAVQSVSYGDVEAGESASTMDRTNTEFQKMGVRGLSIFIASGDDGVANFPARTNAKYCGFNPSFPASSPYVTAVGATQFINGSPSDGEEGASTDNTPKAIVTSGGGFSAQFSRPSYQDSAVSYFLENSASLPDVPHTASGFPSTGFNAAGRAYPDLSALGHNYQVVIEGNTYSVDGTSAASPVTAGMFALINSARLAEGSSTLGFLNPTLYQLSGTGAITDITSGSNACTGYPGAGKTQVCCSNGFTAMTGWDPVTGLGTVSFQDMKSQLM